MIRVLFLIMVLLLPLADLFAATSEKVLLADIRHRPPEMIVDGNFQGGPLKEILEEAANRVDYTVQWRDLPFSRSIEDLKNGTVDIVPRTIRKPDREKFINFLGPIGFQRKDILFLVRKGGENSISSYDDLHPLTVGVKSKTAYFKQFDGDKTVSKKLSAGGDYGLAKLFIAGQIDTIAVLDKGAMESAFAGLGFSDFAYSSYRHIQTIGNYYAFSKSSSQAVLFDSLNKILLEMTESGRIAEIYSKHQVSDNSTASIRMTVAERKWLADNPGPFRVQNESDYPPFNFNDGSKAKGFSIDYMNLLAKKLGLSIIYEKGHTWDEFISMMQDGSLDIMLNIVQTKERIEFLHFTDPFADNPPVFVTRRDREAVRSLDKLGKKSIAIPKGFFYQEILQRKFPKTPLVLTDNLQAALMAVVSGEADSAMGGLAIENHLIQELGLTNLRLDSVITAPAFSNKLRIASRLDSPILRDLLQKAMDNVSQKELVELRNRWFGVDLAAVSGTVPLTQQEKSWLAGLSEPIRVGAETDWPPFDFVENGRPTGFGNDILRMAAVKVGLSLEFVSGPSWAELVALFKTGKLDILPSVYRTPERDKFMIFTSSYAANPSILVAHAANREVNSLNDLAGKTVAVVDGFATAKLMRERHPGIKQKPVKNALSGLKSVSLSKSDAFIGSFGVISYLLKENIIPDIRLTDEVWLKKPEESRLHMGVLKNQTVLREILQKGLDAVTHEEKHNLREKWFPLTNTDNAETKVDLSPEEKFWLQEHPTLRLGDDFSWPPFSFLNTDGEFSGIAAGYADTIAKRLNVTLSPVMGLSWPEVMTAVKKKQLDILPAVAITEERKKFLNFSKPYISFPIVIATRKSGPFVDNLADLAGKRVGVVKGYVTQDFLELDHPELSLVKVKDVATGLDILERGQVEAFVDNLGVITFEVDRQNRTGIKIAAPTKYSFELSFGVRKDWPELVTIMDKTLDSLDDKERAAIKNVWMAINVHFGTDITTIIIWTIPPIIGVSIIIGVILFSNRRLKESEKAIQEREERINLALKGGNLGFWDVNLKTGAMIVNARWDEMLEYTMEELPAQNMKQQTWISTIHPDDLERVLHAGQVYRSGEEKEYHLEYRALTKSGKILWLNSRGGIMSRDKHGEPLRMVGTVQDITPRKESELKIKKFFDIIQSSINYASRIQRAILPDSEIINNLTPDHFVLWKPRDIVGGDIYWCRHWGDGTLLMLGDCTGHGVPGAFMTLIANGALNEASLETTEGDCAALLSHMHLLMQNVMGQDHEGGESDDGIEIGACYFPPNKQQLIFAGARFSLFMTQPGTEEVIELKGDKSGIGYCGIPQDIQFTNHEVELLPDRVHYMTSDGIIDQIGGEKKRSFGKKRFKKLQ
jgi:PAS domain S-box-containing protein